MLCLLFLGIAARAEILLSYVVYCQDFNDQKKWWANVHWLHFKLKSINPCRRVGNKNVYIWTCRTQPGKTDSYRLDGIHLAYLAWIILVLASITTHFAILICWYASSCIELRDNYYLCATFVLCYLFLVKLTRPSSCELCFVLNQRERDRCRPCCICPYLSSCSLMSCCKYVWTHWQAFKLYSHYRPRSWSCNYS